MSPDGIHDHGAVTEAEGLHRTDALLGHVTGAASAAVTLRDAARAALKGRVSSGGRVSGRMLEAEQYAGHGLAWLATYAESLRQLDAWAARLEAEGRLGEMERLILAIGAGEYCAQICGGLPMSQGEMIRLQDMGLSQDDMRGMMIPEIQTLTQTGNTQAARMRLVELMQERSAEITVGRSGLDEELEMIR
ncbi:MAG: acyl-CoA dehydrogenase, partial [Pseudomonadota bacterium]